jgi:addiction module RelE/StbE family toxin
MGDYKIQYTPLARLDFLDILTYISESLGEPRAAERTLEKIETDIRLLRQNPYIAPRARDEYISSQGYRTLISGKYIVFYKIDDGAGAVTIHRVVYGKRNLSWLFP